MGASVKTESIDVVVLCGGLGKRLQPVVNDRPKVMAEINHQPFLDILIGYVKTFGFRRFILCTGYKSDAIKRYYQQPRQDRLEILFSEEKQPLGTGGAIKNSEAVIQSSPFMVLNGDSLLRFELKGFLDFHSAKGALVTMALAKVRDTIDYGAVSLGKESRIVEFNEKTGQKNNTFINGGIYLFEKEALTLMPTQKNFSLERDFFPSLLDKRFYGYQAQGTLIDIGTPERYSEAKKLIGG